MAIEHPTFASPIKPISMGVSLLLMAVSVVYANRNVWEISLWNKIQKSSKDVSKHLKYITL